MKNKVYKEIKSKIQYDFILEKPKDLSFGHYATPIAFSLAKTLKRSPKEIAHELAEKLNEVEIFENVEIINGYINLKLSENFLDEYATWAIKNELDFGKEEKDQTILLEYVSANPTGPLHIGHARGAVVGNALYRIGRHLGYKIDSEYYVNDAGNQIRLLGLSLFFAGREILGLDVEWPEQFYRGEYIIDAAKEAIEELGAEIFNDENQIQALSSWGKEKMLGVVKKNLFDAGIEFDFFVSEKSLYLKWDETLENLKNHHAIYENGGKLWLNSSKYGDEKDRVVVKEDGEATYLAGDIIYHDDKFKRNYDSYINIWGADHHGYIARVKAAVKFLGYDENKLEVILSQMVSLLKNGEPYKMSKRAGNFILMSDVLEEIGKDALRFMFVSKKSDTHLEFDIESLKKEDSSNPIYYINYAHARIKQIFGKANKTENDILDIKLTNLEEDAKNLLFSALLLPEVLDDAFHSRMLLKLTDYLKHLASQFHKFYNENRVVGSQNEEQLLKLFAVVGVSIRVGLGLIGVEAKNKM